ncbi:pentapeptide repeat-containing protein [Nodularia spumigena CS-591/12]|uniref:pentapeptide repeat-containing protein n=1 Tax=Nodularia spumigena TaxID=70799 RepID=UPI00232ED8E0|nr:pentapeptide repeat-containing protein [Nodularia spumigena]MDB9304681.1 pentapeptide repeat-containing protein [Nodularia spumigena CS-591/12]MDB9343525.1 pentapeptide repeat-containing protein [Nodularia spumigena CS-588/06]MDB9360616.1 pentapeptide repeat-containing protein [Nodularia spumigena CS-588/02]MDB9366369.1 pentapeptide repeat-containing protein [Nodularia spumigena CS-588/02A10]MDB9368548.1 pentapeptide repeat-containing protein [Nodularia spumigena CS-586/05]
MSAYKTDKFWRWLIAIIIIVFLSLTLIVFASSYLEELTVDQRIQYRNNVLTSTAIVFMGLAVLINAYYSAKRADGRQKNVLAELLQWRLAAEKNNEISIQNSQISQEKLIVECFMGAVNQLGHEKIETRTGAIYILERVAQDFPQEHWTIMEILAAFVRENAPIQTDEEQEKLENLQPIYLGSPKSRVRRTQQEEVNTGEVLPKIRRDIQAALTVIGRRNSLLDEENHQLDLRNTDIRRADLLEANLERADLRGSNLCGADLRGSHLCKANLEGAQLTGSILYAANLEKANLNRANLSWANLNHANLCGANLRRANLLGVSLRAANLSGANLYKANLQQAVLKVANLSGAKLFLANLQWAKLGKANLQFAGLIGANLNGANLNGANLNGANLNAAKLQQTEIIFADLREASFAEADLHRANLMGSDLNQASLFQANLCETNLMGANLWNANLCDVKLEGAVLTGAKNVELQQIRMALGDRTTRLPDYLEAPLNWRQSG